MKMFFATVLALSFSVVSFADESSVSRGRPSVNTQEGEPSLTPAGVPQIGGVPAPTGVPGIVIPLPNDPCADVGGSPVVALGVPGSDVFRGRPSPSPVPSPSCVKETVPYEIVVFLLTSPEAAELLSNKELETIGFTAINTSTTWNYTLQIGTREAGLGPNGPDSHPCTYVVTTSVTGGVAGNNAPTQPVVDFVCAQNSPVGF